MLTRRELLHLVGSCSVVPSIARVAHSNGLWRGLAPVADQQGDATPPLAPGAPNSPERRALIEAFNAKANGIEKLFEAGSYQSDWTMPYRLFRPKGRGPLPLVVYLHGSGGLGTDNEKQLGLGNTFGTRVWALPDNQERFPCYVVAPQTDRGWVKYGPPAPGDSVSRVVPGLGEGAKAVFGMVEALRKQLAIDARRIYLAGQSMGGRGVWHLTAQRPNLFAAAVACCAGPTMEPATDSIGTPIWDFHGSADDTEPAAISRDRIALLKKAGGHPLYTEYAGVGHNVWEWAFTEPALLPWVFKQRRG